MFGSVCSLASNWNVAQQSVCNEGRRTGRCPVIASGNKLYEFDQKSRGVIYRLDTTGTLHLL